MEKKIKIKGNTEGKYVTLKLVLKKGRADWSDQRTYSVPASVWNRDAFLQLERAFCSGRMPDIASVTEVFSEKFPRGGIYSMKGVKNEIYSLLDLFME